MDKDCYNSLREMNFSNVILIDSNKIEKFYPILKKAKNNRSEVEYFFTFSPVICKYIFENFENIKRLTYLDSDLYFFRSPNIIFQEIGNSSIAIIEHRFSWSTKSNIKFGKYNVGWITFSKDVQGIECLDSWFNDCINWCYQKVEANRYADQKYLDNWPHQYTNLKIIKNKGANLAPWNLSNYNLEKKNKKIYVDQDELVFYHFANINHLGGGKFKTNLSRVFVRTKGIVKDSIYIPYLENLHQNLNIIDNIIESKKNLKHNFFFINILATLSRKIRDMLFYDIIEIS